MNWQSAGFMAAVVGANLFILLYGLLARWWSKPDGWHLFSFMLVVALVLNHAVVQMIWPDYPGRQAVRLFLNWAVALVIWWRVCLFVRVQILRRRSASQAEQ